MGAFLSHIISVFAEVGAEWKAERETRHLEPQFVPGGFVRTAVFAPPLATMAKDHDDALLSQDEADAGIR